MKVLVALSSLLALGAAQYLAYPGYGYSAYNPYPFNAGAYNYYAPTTYAAATPYAAVPAAGVSSQYHAQDEFGQYNYGYADGLSTKTEYKRFDGVTVGSYNYVDANGKVQTVSYTADDVNGFQVKATNLPVAPKANLAAPKFNLKAPVFDGQAPEPVQDTAEVAAAKAEFAKLYADAAAAAEAAPDTDAAEPAEQESTRRRRSAVLLPALAKATFKTVSLDKVEADTPADTTLLELKEKEHETYVPTTYAAPAFHYAAPAFHYAPAVTYTAPVVRKVEVKHVAAPVITYAAPTVTYTTPVVKEVKVNKVVSPFTYSATPYAYGFHPYGLATPFVYNVAAEASETKKESAEEPAVVSAERRKRSAVLLPALTKATFKTVSLDKVEADTPADTTLLELKEKEHETYVPATYAAPAFHYAPAVTYTTPVVKKVEVKHVAAPVITYAAPTVTYTTPVVKEVKVNKVVSPFTYSATPYAYGFHPYGLATPFVYNVAAEASETKKESAEEPAVVSAERRKRSAVLLPALAKATFKTVSLDKVEADTPADTTLLELKEKEHETYVPATYAAPAFHYAPAVTYTAPVVKKVEVKHVAAPVITYAAPTVTYTTHAVKKVASPITYATAPFPYSFGLHPYGLGAPVVYNVAAKTAEVEEKAE